MLSTGGSVPKGLESHTKERKEIRIIDIARKESKVWQRYFTDKNDVVIDPCAGSGTTLLAAMNTMRRAYGFEIKKDFYKDAKEKVLRVAQPKLF